MTILKIGMTGPEVTLAQVALAKLGYNLKGTGYFGSATDTAVSTFQKRAGLTVDGVIGPITLKAIHATAPVTALPTLHQLEITRPLWVEAGINLLGLKEGIGAKDNKTIIDWAHDEGGDISKEYTHDSIPWCALFANHILTKVGLKGTETLWALDFAGKWPATKLNGPAVGAFAPMKRTGGGHITIIVGKDQHGNPMGLGGNQGDSVSIEPFALSRFKKSNGEWDQGFWWPNGVTLPQHVGMNTLPIIKSNGQLSTKEG